MGNQVAIIGGSAAWILLRERGLEVLGRETVATPFGRVEPVFRIRAGANGPEAWFLSRHGTSRYEVSAPFVNYRANIYALKLLGVERILSWSGPGSMRPERYQPGDMVLPADLLDETRQRPATFFTGRGWGFIRSWPLFCPVLQEALRQGLAKAGIPCREEAVYVCTEGPRLETPAEIRKYERLGGDLVGMTLCPEVFLARELEICYAALCYVTNFAEGMVDRPVRHGELFGGMLAPVEKERVDAAVQAFPDVFGEALARLPGLSGECHCSRTMERYRLAGLLGPDWREWVTG